MSQKDILELIEKNPGIFQCDLVELHGYNGSLIKKMALRGELIRELSIAPGRQNKTYKIYPASNISQREKAAADTEQRRYIK